MSANPPALLSDSGETADRCESADPCSTAWAFLDLVLRTPTRGQDECAMVRIALDLEVLARSSNTLATWLKPWQLAEQEKPETQPVTWLRWTLEHQSTFPVEQLLDSQSEQNRFRSLLSTALHLAIRVAAFEQNVDLELERRKRQAIYNLAYGLSHDFNNPLANISTRAGVLLQQIRQEGSTAGSDLLQSIIDNAMRGCEMLGDLMLVARPPALQLQTISLNELLRTIWEESNSWAGKWNIRINLDCSDRLMLNADPTALKEAIWALLRNAIEVSAAGDEIQMHGWIDRDGIGLEIVDQGPGMSKEALANCFDPYYSGREAGRGMGLGLSKAQRIFELHSGEITLENKEAKGCRALARLPAGNDNS